MIDRLYDKIGPVYVGRTYDLHAGVSVNRDFSHKGGDVLIDILRQDCLDKEHVGIPVNGFQNPQIIHVPVSVQIQIGNHIGRIVEQVLEFLDSGGLGERGCDRLQVQAQRYVIVRGCDPGCGQRICPAHRNSRRVGVRAHISW